MNDFISSSIDPQARNIFAGTVPASEQQRLIREELRKQFEDDLDVFTKGSPVRIHKRSIDHDTDDD
ncbi:hypothetical protein MWU61_12235 [Loktanella sp. F6476L]|uniref:hypothetical protein n=1 Tax=Loktanella sp. F6476L TaxID=2926405 RepID=UPI001FF4479E|nr:hypothetical protein [Loktanella sp. F6476L]MCK0121313.1 hypothetical protein [Loktanella sp. F6476L]